MALSHHDRDGSKVDAPSLEPLATIEWTAGDRLKFTLVSVLNSIVNPCNPVLSGCICAQRKVFIVDAKLAEL